MESKDIDYRELIEFAINKEDQRIDLTKVREWLTKHKCIKYYDTVVDVIKDLGYNCNKKLKTSWTLETIQDLNSTSAIAIDEEFISTIVEEITEGIDQEILSSINNIPVVNIQVVSSKTQ